METARNHCQAMALAEIEQEGRLYYHPASQLGGEIVDMVARGLVQTGQDTEGYLYIEAPELSASA